MSRRGRNCRWPRMRVANSLAALMLLLPCRLTGEQTQKASQSREADLTQVSIESLMKMQVTSVSRKQQDISRAPRLLALAKTVLGNSRGS